jgi:exopolyphosphatase/guanosine-5'-triphosphate,3'-diphosphate pyrophosphatase
MTYPSRKQGYVMKQVRERYPDVFDKNNVRKESIHFLAREYMFSVYNFIQRFKH